MSLNQSSLKEQEDALQRDVRKEYWGTKEVAALLQCSEGKAKKLFDERHIEGFRGEGRSQRKFSVGSVLAYAQDHGLRPGINGAYWTSGKVAKALQCSVRRANELFAEGQIKGIRASGEWRQFSVNSVLAYAAQHKIVIDPTFLPPRSTSPILALELPEEIVDFLSNEFSQRIHIANNPSSAQTLLEEKGPACMVVNINGRNVSKIHLGELRFGAAELAVIGIWNEIRDNMDLLTKSLREPVEPHILAMEIRRTLGEPLEL